MQEHKIVDCGFERTIASNYFGPFYLTQLLLDDLKASAPARWVTMCMGIDGGHPWVGGWLVGVVGGQPHSATYVMHDKHTTTGWPTIFIVAS